MEKTSRAAVVPVSCGWSDVGSWHAVWELSGKDGEGNAARGAAVFEDSRNCNVSTDRALVALMTAVQHSFDRSGVTMADHHTESERFLQHVAREADAGRPCPAGRRAGARTPAVASACADRATDWRSMAGPPARGPTAGANRTR